jgi:protein TonB
MLSHFYAGLKVGDRPLRENALNSGMNVPNPVTAVMKTKTYLLTLLVIALGWISRPVIAAEGMEPPVPVRTVAPKFPEEMRRNGSAGLVTVSCLIDEKGNVTEPKVVKSSNEAFSEPAIEALKKWKFKPAKKDGEAVAIRVNIPVQFTID